MLRFTAPLSLSTRHYLALFPADVVVLIDSLDGPAFFWLPDLEDDELEVWWKSRENFKAPKILRDNVYLEPVEYEQFRLAQLRVMLLGRVFHLETSEDLDLWEAILQEGCAHYCRICCDSDTFLKKPNGTFIYHKGYDGSPL